MWETIVGVVVKYWVEFLLGLVVTGATLFIKHYFKLEHKERDRARDAHYAQLKKDIAEENQTIFKQVDAKYDSVNQSVGEKYDFLTKEISRSFENVRDESRYGDTALQNQIDMVKTEMDCLKAGVLSMQGKEFKAECRRLLDENHQITLDEWEELDADHEAYNGLGGNHRGDQLFELVRKKAEHILTE